MRDQTKEVTVLEREQEAFRALRNLRQAGRLGS